MTYKMQKQIAFSWVVSEHLVKILAFIWLRFFWLRFLPSKLEILTLPAQSLNRYLL